MTTIQPDDLDLIEPIDDLRDDDLWREAENDGSAVLILEEARKQAQTTLSIIESQRMELILRRDLHEITNDDSKRAAIALQQKKRATVVFLQLVTNRQARMKARKGASRAARLDRAIYLHRKGTESDNFEPTEHDRKLWADHQAALDES